MQTKALLDHAKSCLILPLVIHLDWLLNNAYSSKRSNCMIVANHLGILLIKVLKMICKAVAQVVILVMKVVRTMT